MYAPTSRRDSYCGTCCYGSVDEGQCVKCKTDNSELYRKGIPVCVKCVRDPKLRPDIVAGLKKGQRQRREANNHNPEAS
jgi:NAD-dependent SIR2 family protein deacetylase